MKHLIESGSIERPEQLLDQIDASGRQEDADDEPEVPPIDDSELPGEEKYIEQSFADGSKFKPIELPAEQQMVEDVLKMSFGQRLVFDKVISYCKDLKMKENEKRTSQWQPEIPKLIVHGILKSAWFC